MAAASWARGNDGIDHDGTSSVAADIARTLFGGGAKELAAFERKEASFVNRSARRSWGNGYVPVLRSLITILEKEGGKS